VSISADECFIGSLLGLELKTQQKHDGDCGCRTTPSGHFVAIVGGASLGSFVASAHSLIQRLFVVVLVELLQS